VTPRLLLGLFGLCLIGLALSGCREKSEDTQNHGKSSQLSKAGIRPHIVLGDIPENEKAAVEFWIEETISLLQSPDFETNFMRASLLYPEIYVSESQDVIPSVKLLERLHTKDRRRKSLWWPKTTVILRGETPTRAPDRQSFGFEANRTAITRPIRIGEAAAKTGQIELGRLHFARYVYGDPVERSCALNTMAHEISHTLSEKKNRFWMHILDSQEHVTPPAGVYEAGYFIGTIAQCTYLQTISRISEKAFEACLLTFSNPETGSRFKSSACDDFPKSKPVTPSGRLIP